MMCNTREIEMEIQSRQRCCFLFVCFGYLRNDFENFVERLGAKMMQYSVHTIFQFWIEGSFEHFFFTIVLLQRKQA